MPGAGGFLAQGDIAQRAIVVKDKDTAPEGGCHQVVLATLNDHVTEGNIGRAALQLHPVVTAVNGEEQAKFGAQEQQPGFYMILYQAPRQVPLGQI